MGKLTLTEKEFSKYRRNIKDMGGEGELLMRIIKLEDDIKKIKKQIKSINAFLSKVEMRER